MTTPVTASTREKREECSVLTARPEETGEALEDGDVQSYSKLWVREEKLQDEPDRDERGYAVNYIDHRVCLVLLGAVLGGALQQCGKALGTKGTA